MRERGILMSAPMVRADLSGLKSQTRRTRGLAAINQNPSAWRFDGWISEHIDRKHDGKAVWSPVGNAASCITGSIKIRCPFGVVGDRLWFKETCSWDSVETVYRATHEGPPLGGKWRPSLLMPRSRARTVREIVSIRVERLHDISEADAVDEGIERLFSEEERRQRPGLTSDSWKNYLWHGLGVDCDHWPHQFSGYSDPRGSYSSLWESINGPGSWGVNPWVWVVEFKKIDARSAA